MRRWRKKPQIPAGEVGGFDPFLLAMIARLMAVRSEGSSPEEEWVAMDEVATLSWKMLEGARAALHAGWDQDAERRMLVERREGPGGVEVRLTRKGRDLMGPLFG